MTNTSSRKILKPGLLELYLRTVGANIVGIVTVWILNYFTPAYVLVFPSALFFREEAKFFLMAFYGLVIGVVVLVQFVVHRPISLAIRQVATEGASPQASEALKARIINLPFIIGGRNLVLWLSLSSVSIGYLFLYQEMELKTCLFILFRAWMIGLISSHLSFFLAEEFARKALYPVFFPKGGLSSVRGTYRISIQRRIRILYIAGTIVPMVILVGTLAFSLWNTNGAAGPKGAAAGEVFLFTLALCGVFVVIALRLNFLVAKSIAKPVEAMVEVVGEVKSGDYSSRIKVESNDEIGILGDAGNAMIEALADREFIRETFGRYITPEIRDHILSGKIPLAGERREATLLFADLRGFTRFVEESRPEDVVRSMREYFTLMERAVRNNNGLVLQFVGDEIESVFGVPVPYNDHALRAVSAALEMREALDGWNKERLEKGEPPFKHGIGIHTGWVLAGNTGSKDHPCYGLVGDPVNVASRIQELTKVFRCDILISEETKRLVGDAFKAEELPPQSIRGHSRAVGIYRIL
jgi:class 3 adenylate cyclase/HAMP domain-containing protein